MAKPTAISLEAAKRALCDPSARSALLVLLRDLDSRLIEDLAPLIMDAITMTEQRGNRVSGLVSSLLHVRPEWANYRELGGSTPLMTAALDLHAEAVQELINAGAAAHAMDDEGDTPLHYLASSYVADPHPAHPIILRILGLLVAAGADPLVADHKGRTPRDVARNHNKHFLSDAIDSMVSSSSMDSQTPSIPEATSVPGPRL